MLFMGQDMVTQKADINMEKQELYKQYNWFANSYPPVVQQASDDFFLHNFQFILLGVSKNINTLMDKDGYFVTKVRIDELYDIFFRVSEPAVALILEKILGRPNSKFNLNKVTDLEAKIITAFNDALYSSISRFLIPAPPAVRRKNYDVIHLTFLVKDIDKGIAAKYIMTLPETVLKPDIVSCDEDNFGYGYFETTQIPVRINVGTSRFKMYEIKNIDAGDIIVLENSNVEHMMLKYKEYEKELNLIPDSNLEMNIEIDNKGEDDMAKSDIDLWDSIEVDVIAQFDAVKMSLGELKRINEGLVVDISSIFGNKVQLKVDEKVIASGELVIVNDRYGVRVTEVLKDKYNSVDEILPSEELPVEDEQTVQPEEENIEEPEEQPQQTTENSNNEEDEFDYSDFELEDEDI